MIRPLNPQIDVICSLPERLELRDRRTGLHVALEGNEEPVLVGGELSGRALEALTSLGFVGDTPIDELRALQRPFRDEMQAELRNQSLRDMVQSIAATVPFYRASRGYDLDSIADTGDLPKLPILRKSDVQENLDDLISSAADISSGLADERYTVARTSGTAGERMQVFVDREMDHVPPDYEEVWGLSLGDTPRTAILTTPLCTATECHLGRSTMAERTKFGIVLYLNSTDDLFNAPEALIRNFAEELWTFRPQLLLVNPFYLMWFGREAQRLKIGLPPVEAILTSYQYAARSQRKALREMFGAPVFDLYTATELCGCMIGVECKNGHLHVFENHSIVEVTPDVEHHFSDGVGSLLVTNFASRIMPLLRYEVGDLARLVEKDCDCPLSDWQCMELHGRVKDAVAIKDRWFTTKEIDDVISAADGIDFYRLTVVGGASADLELIPAPQSDPWASELVARLRSELGLSNVNVRRVSELRPERSMKFPLTGMRLR